MNREQIQDLLSALAADRGLPLTPEQLEAAAEMYLRYRDELQTLRDVPLSYLPPYIEPATALRWIERGGRSA